MKVKILLSYPCRSDEALITPIVEKLNQENWCDVFQINLVSGNYLDSYKICEDHLNSNQYDLCIAIGDRIEQLSLVQCAFFHNIKIAHYGSGITNTIATFDDINRHSIALMADVCLCEDEFSMVNVLKLKHEIHQLWLPPSRLETLSLLERCYMNNIYNVGNLYLEGLDDVDESLVPSEPYDLILINKKTIGEPEYFGLEFMKERLQVYIGSNPDGMAIHESLITYESVPRPQFLGLLKHCQRFITNSSSAFYEAPFFLKPEQIIQVGERNKNRSTPREWNQDYKTSEKIVQIIKKWWLKNGE